MRVGATPFVTCTERASNEPMGWVVYPRSSEPRAAGISEPSRATLAIASSAANGTEKTPPETPSDTRVVN